MTPENKSPNTDLEEVNQETVSPSTQNTATTIGPSTARPLPDPNQESMGMFGPANFSGGTPTPQVVPQEDLSMVLDEEPEKELAAQDQEAVEEVLDGMVTADKVEDGFLTDVNLDSLLEEAPADEETPVDPGKVEIVIPLSSYEEIITAMNNESMAVDHDPVKLRALIKDSASRLSALRSSAPWYCDNQALLHKALADLNKTLTGMQALLTDTLVDKVDGVSEGILKNYSRKKDTSTVVTGDFAVTLMTAAMQGMRKIPLWNSGFWITIRPLRIPAITAFFNTARSEAYEYGRELGAWYFVFADLLIKQMVVQHLLPTIIVRSNFKSWRETKKLLSNISIQDYDTLLWGMATLMFPEGVPIKYTCAHKDCRHVEELHLDISRLRLLNRDLITEEMRQFMNGIKERSEQDLRHYRENILKFIEDFNFSLDNKATGVTTNWRIQLGEPSIWEFLQRGEEFNHELLSNIDSDAPATMRDEINQQIIFNYYKMLIPWIRSITMLNSEGEVEFTVINDGDLKADKFMAILEIHQMENTGLAEKVREFILKSKITHIAYRYDRCPVCQTVPSTSVAGFIPYDVQSNFFTLCLIRLAAALTIRR